MTAFPDLLRSYREQAGLSQSELARRSKLSPNYICRLEQGNREPSRETARALASALALAEEHVARLLESGGFAVPSELIDRIIAERDRALSQTVVALSDAELLSKRLETTRTRYGSAISRNEFLRHECDRLKDEIAALKESERDLALDVVDIRVTRFCRLLAELQAGGETHAQLIARMLEGVERLTKQAEQVAGLRKGKRAAA